MDKNELPEIVPVDSRHFLLNGELVDINDLDRRAQLLGNGRFIHDTRQIIAFLLNAYNLFQYGIEDYESLYKMQQRFMELKAMIANTK